MAGADYDYVIVGAGSSGATLAARLTEDAGTRVLLQSNDYFSEPTHINCVASVEEFAKQAALTTVEFAGALPTKKYTRFMLIGTV